jgi:hypothetical protein
VTPQRVRAIRHGLLLAGIAILAVVLVQGWQTATPTSAGEAYDAFAYWEAAREVDPYGRPVLGAPVAYYYSPVFLQALGPLFALSFPIFLAIWYGLSAASLVAVARAWLPVAVVVGFVPLEILRGNIETMMALALVAGFRWPAAWAFILLTKVTPGIGLLYFVGRRDWRSLAIAIGATAAIVAVSFALAPTQWFAWGSSLIANTGVNIDWPYFPVPLFARLPIAAALALLAGVRDWRWLVPVASTLAMPALWPVNLTLLVAIFPLLPKGRPNPSPAGRAAASTEMGAAASDARPRPTPEVA